MNYWDKVTSRRISRRRALGATSAAAAAAAFLAACGGSDSDDSPATGGSGSGSSGLIYTPTDSSSQAKVGGTLKHFVSADVPTLDSLANNNSGALNAAAAFAYPRVMKFKLAKYPQTYQTGEFEGEMATGYETSPDKLTITFKLRQGMKWDPRPPTNSRNMDAQDIVFSWEKFKAVNPGATAYAYNATTAPSAPIETVTAPDSQTIVVRLHEPDSSVITQFAGTSFSPMPREADGGFDPKTTVRGHGPWLLDEYVPSGRFVYTKNPNYYMQGRPYIDRVEVPIVPEYATRLAQFRAGNIHTDVMGGNGGGAADILPTKKDLPQILVTAADSYPQQASWLFTFGYDGNAPFKDQRLRQAASMLIDREGYIDALDNRDGYAKEGVDLDVVYGTIVTAGYSGYWIDPQDEKSFGPTAKYLKFNMDEAKKLIAAAGTPGEFDFNYNSSTQFPIQARVVELYNAMFLDGGLKPKLNGIPNGAQYSDEYVSGYLSAGYTAGTKKGYGGITMGQERPYGTVALLVYGSLHKDGAYYKGMTPNGLNPQNGDPTVNDLAEKIKREFDVEKQKTLTHELIRYFTGQSYYVPQPSQVKGLSAYWPAIGNLGVFSNGVSPNIWAERHINWWMDTSKAPFV